MDDSIDSLILRTSEPWQRTKLENVYRETLHCVAVEPLPGLDVDALLPREPLAAIRVAHAWADGTGQRSLLKDVFSIRTGRIKIIASNKPVIVASRQE